ncbi:MAG: FixH family protein [Chitinophagaceae bacterium]|nr:FixH family protein [Chitinophagaceae bacterium]
MNWGNKLLLTFIVFAAGMGFLVYRSVTTNFELVEKDYYKQELRYQQKIDGMREANNLTAAVNLSQTENGIHLQFPDEMKAKSLTGEIWFYCAYNQKKDKKFNLQTGADASQSIRLQDVEPGSYTVKIIWKDGAKEYYSEKPLTVL